MTKKLYYEDAYIKEFEAVAVDVLTDGDSIAVVLDRTAFFPEEGGQSADTGVIGTALVLDVREKDGKILHYLDSPIEIGKTYVCRIDFDDRFIKMQCHTAEHIISGAIKRLFGFDNVGFHLGATEVTMDINGILTREQLDEVELIANRAVFDNVDVRTYFPSPSELDTLEYRSKLDLTENVRIVDIDGYDMCACCAPHVSRTGEIGLIKILDFEKHRGGLRINITAGYRALFDYREKYRNVQRISAMFSEPQPTVADATESFVASARETQLELKNSKLKNARLLADIMTEYDGSLAVYYPDMGMDEMREFANSAKLKVGGALAVLSGSDGNLKYILTSNEHDLSGIYKDVNRDLCGRGGGRDNMISGTFLTDAESVIHYFEKLKL